MARVKQATPLRRETSSEYFSKADTPGTPTRSPRNLDRGTTSGASPTANANTESTTGEIVALAARKEAGLPQLIMAVAGIYASL
jgi:UDP-galactose transporter B1